MVNKVGLLPAARADQVWPAFQSFSLQGKDTWTHSTAFRKENESRSVIIEFVGVWCVPWPLLPPCTSFLICDLATLQGHGQFRRRRTREGVAVHREQRERAHVSPRGRA